MLHFILRLHALCPGFVLSLRNCQELWLPTDDLRYSSSWSSPPLMFLRDIHSTITTAKRSVYRLRHRLTQGLVLDSAPRMVYLSSRRLLVFHYRSSTASLRLPLCGMRALPPMLMLLPSPHNLGSPNRYSATGSPSRISNSCLRARAGLKPAITTAHSSFR